jgi:hypothetical protein
MHEMHIMSHMLVADAVAAMRPSQNGPHLLSYAGAIAADNTFR